MSSRIDLVPIEAEELLAGIQRQIDAGNAGILRRTGAVQFFRPSSFDSPQKYAQETLAEENFPEQDYLLANPDVADAVKRGEFKSGFEHWIAAGKEEGRSFEPAEFRGLEPLENLIGKRTPSLPRLKRLCYEMQARLAQMGDAPPSPGTLRGAIGRRMILVLRRLLWWYTRSVSVWADVTTKAVQEQHAALEHLGAAQEQSHRALASLQGAVANQAEQVASRIRQLESNAHVANELNQALVSQLRSLEDRVNARERKMNAADAQQSEQIRGLTEALAAERAARESDARRLAGEIHDLRGSWSGAATEYSDHTSDALYLAFEDVFRGPREEIKQRQSVYLTFLKEIQAGTAQLPILDLGCGRGEWLELLRDHSMTARGQDGNVAMVEYCRVLGLDVEPGDALAYLRRLRDCSLGAVTCFHMIEHIPFDSVLSLLREGIRVLKPGGLLILETPNPKNLTVASYNFYLDPTHLRPLPSEMLRFFVEATGFSDCQVLELHPAQAPAHEGLNISQHLGDLLYGPRDYGLIARRPANHE